MKILWMSDSPTTPSFFGDVTRAVCAGLADYGHQVSIIGWQTLNQERWHKCTLYPLHLQHKPTMNALLGYLHRVRPDVIVMLGEIMEFPRFHHPLIAKFEHIAGIPWALYYTFDGDMGAGRFLPPEWIDILKTVDVPIAMGRYGAEVSQANRVNAAHIPYGVDTKLFHPPANKELARQAFGYEDRFVILADVRNYPCEQSPRTWEIFTLEIFRRFAEGKDDVLLHLRCDPDDPAAHTLEYCCNLRSEIAALDLTSKVRITAGMSMSTGELPMRQLAQLYQAVDVHLLAWWGEGFGLPTLQAAATGVIPMAADYSASRELVLQHGEAIRVQHFCPGPLDMRLAFIDIDDAVSRLERLYRDRERLITKAKSARRFAEEYDWQRIVSQWHELLQHRVLPRVRYPWLRRAHTAGTQVEQRYKQVRECLNTMFTFIPRAAVKSILVCGGEKGYTVHLLREQGFRACGFERSDREVREGQWEFPELASVDEELGVQLLRKDDVTKLEGYADNSFDLVLAIGTLEHLSSEQTERAVYNMVHVSRKYVYLALSLKEQEEDADEAGDQTQSNVQSRQYWERLLEKYDVEYLTPETLQVPLPSTSTPAWHIFPLQVKKMGTEIHS